MGSLQLRGLGPLEAVVDGVPARLGGVKERTVLACLMVRANCAVATDVLVEAVWPNRAPQKPAAVLKVYVSNLRRLLDPQRAHGASNTRLITLSDGYRLQTDDDELDLLQFAALLAMGDAAAGRADVAGAAGALRQAVGLFRGPAFPELTDTATFQPDLAALEERRLNSYQDLFDLELALGRHSVVLPELVSLVDAHPFRERLWAALVLALYRCDRQADSLAACRKVRRLFADELGLDVGAKLRQIEGAVLRQDPALAAPTHVAGPADSARRGSTLPAAATPIVGREVELTELDSLLGDDRVRLVTVTGPGGIGKTRTALAAADYVADHKPGDVAWVELAHLTDPVQVPAAISATLGLLAQPDGDVVDTLTTGLRDRHLLLVLDNFEQVDQAWELVAHLLQAAPAVRFLVTSRKPLRIRGEHEYPLPPLALPPSDGPLEPDTVTEAAAVRLLLDRARAVRHHFTVTNENASTIAKICHRLDGIPLAIELAAAQLRFRSEQALLVQLETSINSLPSDLRDLPDRQRTLHATIDWSYRLLDPPTQRLFCILGVFDGDPTTAAVETVCGDRTHTGARLVMLADHSLLSCHLAADGQPRWTMLAAIREFVKQAFDTDPDASTVRRRHAEHFLAVAADVGPELIGADQVNAYATLRAVNPDLLAALRWASATPGTHDLALRLVGLLWHYFELSGNVTEPSRLAETVLAAADHVDPLVAARAYSGTATLCWLQGLTTEATQLHRRALGAFRRARDSDGIAWSLMCLAVQQIDRGNTDVANLLNEALTQGDATARTQSSIRMVEGVVALHQGDVKSAQTRCEQSLALARTTGDRWLLGRALVNLADNAERSGDYSTARLLLTESLQCATEVGDRALTPYCLEAIGTIAFRQHEPEQAAKLLGAADRERTQMAMPLNNPERQRLDTIIADIRAATGPIAFAVAWTAGVAITLDHAIAEASGA